MVAVDPDANPPDDPADAAALAGYALALHEAVAVALPGWGERVVAQRWREGTGQAPPADLAAAAREAGQRALDEAGPALLALLEADVEQQRTNPLAILRQAARHATEALAAAGLPPVPRDEQAERLHPHDLYDLGPAAFADLGPSVHEAGLTWGAAKAHVVMARHRRP